MVAGILGAAVAAPANAAILTVTTTQDNLTSGDHQCSLREAIAAVNTPGSASDCGLADDVSNTIVLGPQPYNLTIHPDVSDGQLTGDLDVSGTTPLTIAGAGVSATSLNGALLQDRIMHVIPGATVTIKDLTLTGARAPKRHERASRGHRHERGSPVKGGDGFPGGGIRNGGTLTLQAVAVTSNHAGSGGLGGAGELADQGAAGGNGGAGGGIQNSGKLTLDRVTVSGNHAGTGGAGGAGGSSSLTSGAPGGSGAGRSSGGAIATNGGSVTITNSTLSGNFTRAGGNGGLAGSSQGVSAMGGHAGNGSAGGGLSVSGNATVSLTNVTIDGNQEGDPGTPGAGNPVGGAGNPAFAGGVYGSTTPNLGPLQDNGGPSQTISLGSGSAAIDQIPGAGAGCQATDQRGVARPSGSACDIGAYEVAGPKAQTQAAGSVSTSGAVLNGSVTPNAGDASVQFLYGTTSTYGAATSMQHLSGVSAIPATARIGHLKPNTTYHFRIVVTAMDGAARGADRTFTTSPAPKLSRLALKPAAFKAGSGGTTITYSDSQAARTTFVVLQRLSRHRTKRVARFSHADRKGTNSVRFRARGLKPGNYILQASSQAHGQTSRTLTIAFTISHA